MKKLIGALALLALVTVVSAQDMVWLSQEPDGAPDTVISLLPCEEVTLYVILYNASDSAHAINIPIMWDPAVEVTAADFIYENFNFMGWCQYVWNFFNNHYPDEMIHTWYAWTATYACGIPTGSVFTVGYITFHCVQEGTETWILAAEDPNSGLPILYTDGRDAMNYFPEFVPVLIVQGTGVKEEGARVIPKVNFLAQARPNPFATSTSIAFGITKDDHVTLRVYNVAGRAVRTLVDEDMKAGTYTVNFNGRDDAGRRLAKGVYFYTIETSSFRSSKKLVLH